MSFTITTAATAFREIEYTSGRLAERCQENRNPTPEDIAYIRNSLGDLGERVTGLNEFQRANSSSGAGLDPASLERINSSFQTVRNFLTAATAFREIEYIAYTAEALARQCQENQTPTPDDIGSMRNSLADLQGRVTALHKTQLTNSSSGAGLNPVSLTRINSSFLTIRGFLYAQESGKFQSLGSIPDAPPLPSSDKSSTSALSLPTTVTEHRDLLSNRANAYRLKSHLRSPMQHTYFFYMLLKATIPPRFRGASAPVSQTETTNYKLDSRVQIKNIRFSQKNITYLKICPYLLNSERRKFLLAIGVTAKTVFRSTGETYFALLLDRACELINRLKSCSNNEIPSMKNELEELHILEKELHSVNCEMGVLLGIHSQENLFYLINRCREDLLEIVRNYRSSNQLSVEGMQRPLPPLNSDNAPPRNEEIQDDPYDLNPTLVCTIL